MQKKKKNKTRKKKVDGKISLVYFSSKVRSSVEKVDTSSAEYKPSS